MINMQSWMFLSSYEKLRQKLLKQHTIVSMAHLGARAFDTIGGEVVSTTAFVLENTKRPDAKGVYVRLVDGRSEAEKAAALQEAIQNPDCGWFYRATAVDFQKIPGSPIAYWLKHFDIFNAGSLNQLFESGGRLKTHDSQKYIRYAWEVSHSNTFWKRIVKGGEFRKWLGHEDFLADWSNDALTFYGEKGGLPPEKYKEKEGICWSKITSSHSSFRFKTSYTEYDSASPTIFLKESHDISLLAFLAYLNSPVSRYMLAGINPTLNTQLSDVLSLPSMQKISNVDDLEANVQLLIKESKSDWDSYETSWDFSASPLLLNQQFDVSFAVTYATLRQQWQEMALEMQRLEEENNRLFIAAYDLQDELAPDVPLSEITLTCNPHYRYGSKQLSVDSRQLAFFTNNYPLLTDNWPQGAEGHELRLLDDTMREFISYAVGCMFGRYSLDKPGLILANQGETVEDYLRKVTTPIATTQPPQHVIPKSSEESFFDSGKPQQIQSKIPHSADSVRNDMVEGEPGQPQSKIPHSADSVRNDTAERVRSDTTDGITFMPDRDNAIPMLGGDWFPDDITERFKKFLRVTFGEDHYEENLAFIEAAIGRDIRGYFLRDFYNDHVKMYKKRPIYWLFSSAKGSFNVLIYLHRYRPDTLSVILNDYLREFRAKLTAGKSHLQQVERSAATSQSDKTRALKEIAGIDKTLAELRQYEDDILYPLATRQIEIDLDDGVVMNYNKFGPALKKVTGLSQT